MSEAEELADATDELADMVDAIVEDACADCDEDDDDEGVTTLILWRHQLGRIAALLRAGDLGGIRAELGVGDETTEASET